MTSPERTAPWIAAPTATHSMGSTPLSGALPNVSSTNLRTRGIRVCPPIRIILLTSPRVSFASSITLFIGALIRSTIGRARSSNLARVNVKWRCLSCIMNGRSTSVVTSVESSIFAFSAASFSRVIAILSVLRSIPLCRLNSSIRYPTTALSMSAPPVLVSPLVAST